MALSISCDRCGGAIEIAGAFAQVQVTSVIAANGDVFQLQATPDDLGVADLNRVRHFCRSCIGRVLAPVEDG